MIDSRDNRSIQIFVVSIGALIAIVVLFCAVVRYQWRDTTPRGILRNFSDWPEPVQQLKLNLDDKPTSDPSFQVFLLYGQPAQILSTVICKIDYSAETFQTIESSLKLSPVKHADAIQIHRQVVATRSNDWWPATDSNADYFACQSVINGDEGPLYWVAVDRSLGRILVYYYFNF